MGWMVAVGLIAAGALALMAALALAVVVMNALMTWRMIRRAEEAVEEEAEDALERLVGEETLAKLRREEP